jgi:hypothetical protein
MARAEVTGRKPQPTAGTSTETPPPIRGPPVPIGAYSIAQFCAAHDLSEDMFYKMQRQGWGPAVMKVGTRTLISVESAAAWRREREAATAATTPGAA